MKKTLSNLGVEYSGTFGDLDRSELSTKLMQLGANLTNGVNTKTKLLIVGRRASRGKIQKARLSGIDIIEDREQIDALLAGTPLDEVLAMKEEEVVEKQDLDEVIANIRHIIAEGPTQATWQKIVNILDATQEDDLDPLLGYIIPYIEEWPWSREVNDYWGMTQHDDVRANNEAWTEQLFTGKDSKKFKALRSLQLHGKKLVGKVAVRLFESEHLENLRSLDISNNKIPGTFFKEWAKSGRWPGLELLKLNNNKVNASGMAAFADATHLTALTHVMLQETGLDDKSFAHFLEASHLNKLTYLDISQNDLSAESAQALARAEHLSQLTHLRGYNLQQGGWLEALSTSPVITGLEHLNFEDAIPAPEDWEALGKHHQNFQTLSYFHMPGSYSFRNIDEEAFASMCQGLPSLQVLKCSYNQLTDQSIEAIVNSPFASKLTHLEIRSDLVTDEGLLMLAEATHMSALKALTAWSNRTTIEGLKALLKAEQFTLTSLATRREEDKKAIQKTLKGAKHLSKSFREYIEFHHQLD